MNEMHLENVCVCVCVCVCVIVHTASQGVDACVIVRGGCVYMNNDVKVLKCTLGTRCYMMCTVWWQI